MSIYMQMMIVAAIFVLILFVVSLTGMIFRMNRKMRKMAQKFALEVENQKEIRKQKEDPGKMDTGAENGFL